MTPRARRLAALALVLGMLASAGSPRWARAVGEDPAAELTEVLRSLGPPGMVWGRLAVEEESPVGTWTPLSGVQVTLYPATPALVAELDRIRQSARDSGSQYESAVSRVQAALAIHQGRIDRQTAPAGTDPLVAEPPLLSAPRPSKPPPAAPVASTPTRPTATTGRSTTQASPPEEPAHPWRQKTDPAGLFAFDAVPSGDWLVVLIRVSPYSAEKLRAEPKPRQNSRTRNFLPRAAGPAKEAEVWLSRVRVVTGERVGLELSDRARWLVGPVR